MDDGNVSPSGRYRTDTAHSARSCPPVRLSHGALTYAHRITFRDGARTPSTFVTASRPVRIDAAREGGSFSGPFVPGDARPTRKAPPAGSDRADLAAQWSALGGAPTTIHPTVPTEISRSRVGA